MASPVPITFPLRRRPVRLIVVHIRPKASQVQKVPIGDIASLARYERGRQPLYRAWLGPRPCYNLTGDTTALTGGQMTSRTLLLALCVLPLSEPPAAPKSSGGGNKHDIWDSHHIDDLPPEVRHYIAGICKGPPAAQQDFATYSLTEKRWRINLEYLRCNGLISPRKPMSGC